MPDTQLWQLLRKQEPAMRERIASHLVLSTAYTYRDVSDRDLHAYNAFLSSKSGVAMYRKSMQALEAVLLEAMEKFGTRLMVLMGHKKI